MVTLAKLDCIPFTEYIPNKCWKQANSDSDPTSTLWVTLPTCTEIPKVVVINKSEVMELFFTKLGSTIRIKDNCICYHRSNLIGKKNLQA
ncbi:MAG: hypothetical protein AUG16_05565 [Thaumarchaeota archaeon 13_1_20CM_2_39_20]|nr:MAG: hypothetical protein AUG16_05565 [Thaumarchaeota archaeon 13_1_20CM_2_39_20]